MILGANGMLGSVVSKLLMEQYKIINVARSDSDYNVNLLDFNLLKKVILIAEPDVIINCSAIVSLQRCESDYELAYETHVGLPKFLSRFNVYNILVSTDSVYSGKGKQWPEDSTANPLNSYAKTKFLGEKFISPKGLVLRTNIYGFISGNKGGSLYEWGYKSMSAGLEVEGYTDMKFNPVSVYQFARVISNILLKFGHSLTGVYNIGSKETVSKFEFLKEIHSLLMPNSGKVNPKIYRSNSSLARPLDTSMSITKIEANNIEMPHFLDGLKEVFENSCLEVGL